MKRLLLVGSSLLLLAMPSYADVASEILLGLSTMQQVMLFLGFVAISVGIFSSGWALSISLGAYAGCSKEMRAHAFIPAIMPGSQGVYAFAISFLMMQKMTSMPLQTAFAGVLCGLPCLYSALGQAKTAAVCIKAMSNGQMEHGQVLIATSMQTIFALAGLASACLILI